MAAILFGSISTLADTSERQREAFNEAFDEHGLGWRWERAEYTDLLRGSGGRDRIAAYAEERGESVDAAAVHASKSRIFQHMLASEPVEPRPGVAETVAAAREAGVRLALVTTTTPDNVAALIEGLRGRVDVASFDLVLDNSHVEAGKPDPAVYRVALSRLHEDAEACVAIEDNVGGVAAARGASIACVAFPNQNTTGHDFDDASTVVDALDPTDLLALVGRTTTA